MSDTEPGSPAELPDLIDWSSADKEPSRFITNTVVQVGDSELTLLLFEVLAPYVESSMRPEKWAAKWRAKLPLEAICYGRFVLTPERCEQLIDILQQQLDLYWDNQRKKFQQMERQSAGRDPDPEAEEEIPTNFPSEDEKH